MDRHHESWGRSKSEHWWLIVAVLTASLVGAGALLWGNPFSGNGSTLPESTPIASDALTPADANGADVLFTVALDRETTQPTVTGSIDGEISVDVVTGNSGQLRAEDGYLPEAGPAMRFPRAEEADLSPTAVVSVTSADSESNAMNVGTRPFAWSATFMLDEDVDADPLQGDNVFQRGLGNGASQWKLQADRGSVRCTLRVGDRQASTPSVNIESLTWFRAACERRITGSGTATLSMTVERWDGSRFVREFTNEAPENAFGSVIMPSSVPATIGGKLENSGAVHPVPDQFNGVIAEAQLTLLE